MNLFDPPPKCRHCNDQGWVRHSTGGMVSCPHCRRDTFKSMAQIGTRIFPENLEPSEYQVAMLVSKTDSLHPIKIRELMEATGLNDRAIKGICRNLRDTHLLPIGASRKEPAGIYWITNAEAFLTYYHTTKAQALSELKTLGRMCRKHFPELVGQLSLEF